jgi:mono/diheme cytochrome c family protein
MNYPIWDLQASGLMIAFIAIVHVFVSHFAVGGGLFLVLTEWRARKDGDDRLLDYVRRHSRFFILLTLVFGAATGVGIWFTIGLVHPSATSSLINAFVWGWAIEWTFFLTEIAAALVYYYGWDRLSARLHMIVGWIYFGAAWLSLVIINGILSYMMTPGDWLQTHGFWDGFFNPTYWPSLVVRTLGAMGLAGVYALLTASFSDDAELKSKLSRYAALWWVLPMAIGLPLGMMWFFSAAGSVGVPLAEIFASDGAGFLAIVGSAFTTATTGYPAAQTALKVAIGGIVGMVVLTFALFFFRRDRFGRLGTAALMVAAFLAVGGAEWVREDLRKPYVIGSYMFVHSIRLPAPEGSPVAESQAPDRFLIDEATQAGILKTAAWTRLPDEFELASDMSIEDEARAGEEIFMLLCRGCHTVDGYQAIRPLVEGKSAAAIESIIDRLALPKGADGKAASWSDSDVQVVTWRGRRMPPFVGTEAEEHALAVYLATLGGGDISKPDSWSHEHPGAHVFEDYCAACHSADADWPIEPRVAGKSETELYDAIGRLEELNEMMPPFDASDQDRRDLAAYLAGGAGGGAGDSGVTVFEDNCAACHSPDSDWPIEARVAGKSETELYDAIGRLEELNEMMPPFEGTEEERAALAKHLAAIGAGGAK